MSKQGAVPEWDPGSQQGEGKDRGVSPRNKCKSGQGRASFSSWCCGNGPC